MFSDLLHNAVGWFEDHPWVVWVAAGLSLCTLLAGLVVVPWIIVRIPPDYFTHARRSQSNWNKMHPALQIAVMAGKNLAGALLIFAGFIMLFVPGPGIVTALVGLALVDVPGKRRLERWIVARPAVFASLNKLRKKYNHPPLEHPEKE